jgi:hypothetical protein
MRASTKWSDDPLVPIIGRRVQEALAEAEVSRLALAIKLKRRGQRLSAQTLDYLCAGRQRRCRAGLRRALAQELGVEERWLAGEIPATALTGGRIRRGAEESLRWGELVLSLKLPEAAHAALLDLPDATGQATILAGLVQVDRSWGWTLRSPSWSRRASLLELRAWRTWLEGWIRDAGAHAVRRALAGWAEPLRERFGKVNRYLEVPETKGQPGGRRRSTTELGGSSSGPTGLKPRASSANRGATAETPRRAPR